MEAPLFAIIAINFANWREKIIIVNVNGMENSKCFNVLLGEGVQKTNKDHSYRMGIGFEGETSALGGMGLLGSEVLGKGGHPGGEGFRGDGPLADQLAHKRVKRLDITVTNKLVGLEESGEEQTTDDPEDWVFDHGRQSGLPVVIIVKVAVMQFEIGVINHEFLLGDAADGPGVGVNAADNLVQVPSSTDGLVSALDVPPKIVSLLG